VEIYRPHPKQHYQNISQQCGIHYYKFQNVHEPTVEEFPEKGLDDCWVNKEAYTSSLKGLLTLHKKN
jgi:hypothetical protein